MRLTSSSPSCLAALAAWLIWLSGTHLLIAAPQKFDLVIYGATAGGSMAAVAAAQSGLHVALLEPGTHVGGMVSGGLSHSDVESQEQLVGGLTRQFFSRVGLHYGKPVAWGFEPHVAEATFHEMLDESHVRVFFHARLRGVVKEGTRIQILRTEEAGDFAAPFFLDSGYEGDLMKAAGVSYVVGREGASPYGESLAGRQDLLPGCHQFSFAVSAEGFGGKGLLSGVVPQEQVASTGQGDGHFQSYCFRLCLAKQESNRLPITRPADYQPERYELARRYLQSANGALGLRDFLGISPIPNDKADINSTGPVSTDLLGASWEYPEASYPRRKQLWEEHLSWAHGLLYFLSNDPSVPVEMRRAMLAWGRPKDEFTDTGHWPHQLYIREGRRMRGEYVLTQHDLQESREKYDSVGMAGYNIDIREVQWLAHKVYHFPQVIDQVFTEGYLSMPVEPWQIPYRALLPRQSQCSNLLATATISASTIAYASFRMEANYMIAGESAGVAAALAFRSGHSLHQVDLQELQKELLRRGQIVSFSQISSTSLTPKGKQQL
jgi:FAD dependent oxidoreductase